VIRTSVTLDRLFRNHNHGPGDRLGVPTSVHFNGRGSKDAGESQARDPAELLHNLPLAFETKDEKQTRQHQESNKEQWAESMKKLEEIEAGLSYEQGIAGASHPFNKTTSKNRPRPSCETSRQVCVSGMARQCGDYAPVCLVLKEANLSTRQRPIRADEHIQPTFP